MIFSDRKLAQKLERTEARANASFVDTRAELAPATGAEWIEVAGAYAMFDGVDSPLTQTFGLGVFDEIAGKDLDELEAFFAERRAPVFHEVSPLADFSLMALLGERGYRPIELTSVMFQPLEPPYKPEQSSNGAVTTRVIEPGEDDLWARTAADGWATEAEGLAEFMLDVGKICANAEGGFPFLAESEGRSISAGMLYIFDDVALLGGASTVPDGRRKGGQTALLDARLRFAFERGCRLAMMCALPGSQSQRNAEKNGFRIAYTRTKWQLMK
ncbi:MAG TPA: GNAT family N-acetyltransferase [Pyrinomonadaceae bacterium]|jgi:GNAT superfamily N-acetyltransferase